MGKRKKPVKKGTKKAKLVPSEEEGVINVNIILDFEPGDDFEKHEKKESPAAASNLTLTRYISRGKVIKLRPMRVEVPSVESLFQRYRRYLAVPENNDVHTSATNKISGSSAPDSSPESCLSASIVDPRKLRSDKRSSRLNVADETVASASAFSDGTVTLEGIPKPLVKKNVHSAPIDHCSDSSSSTRRKINANCRSRSTLSTLKSEEGVQIKQYNSTKNDLVTKHDIKSDMASALPSGSLSLPSRISLNRDWMKKLLSKRAELKHPNQNKAELKPASAIDSTDKSSFDKNETQADQSGSAGSEIEDTVRIRIEKTESLSDKVGSAAEKDDNTNVNQDNDEDPEEDPIICEEIGDPKDIQLELIVKKEPEEDVKVEPKEKSNERCGGLEKDGNLIRFNEDSSDDDDGPSEDPLMLVDDSDISVLEDDCSESNLAAGSFSTIQVNNEEVRIIPNLIENTQHTRLSIARNAGTTQDSMGLNVARQNPSNHPEKPCSLTEHEVMDSTGDNCDYTVDSSSRDAIELQEQDEVDESISIDSGTQNRLAKTYKCPFCNEVCEDASSLEAHGQMFHASFRNISKKPYACPQCRKRFTMVRFLNYHIKFKHNNKSAKQSRHDSKSVAVDESQCQDVTRTLMCTQGQRKSVFESEEALNKHVKTLHIPSTSEATVSTHNCPDCSMTFKWHSNLSQHRRFAHRGGSKTSQKLEYRNNPPHPKPIEVNTPRHHKPKEVAAPLYSKQLNKLADPSRKFRCPVCPASFHYSSGLSAHKRFTHNNGKLLKSFSWLKESSNGGEHTCQVCGISFIWASNLSAHMRFIHKEMNQRRSHKNKPVAVSGSVNSTTSDSQFAFTCSECTGCSFDSVKLLSRHKRLIHGARSRQVAVVCPTPHVQVPVSVVETDEAEQSPNETGSRIQTVNISDNEDEPMHIREKFDCQLCNSTFQDPIQLQEHAVMHTKNTPSDSSTKNSCTISSSKPILSTVIDIKRHTETHSASADREKVNDTPTTDSIKKGYPCSLCHMSFVYTKSLKIHERLVHKKKIRPKVSGVTQEPPKIQTVPQITGNQFSGNRNYICVQCDNLSFSASEDLLRHNQVIHREKFTVALICETGSHSTESAVESRQLSSTIITQVAEEVITRRFAEDVQKRCTVSERDVPSDDAAAAVINEEFHEVDQFGLRASTQIPGAGYLHGPTPLNQQDLSPVHHHRASSSKRSSAASHAMLKNRENENSRKDFKCSRCPKTFAELRHRQTHERAHGIFPSPSSLQSAVCTVCDLRLSQPRHVSRHIGRVHGIRFDYGIAICLMCKSEVPHTPAGPQKYMCCKFKKNQIAKKKKNALLLPTDQTGRKKVATMTRGKDVAMSSAKYICVLCGAKFCREPEIVDHFAEIHSTDELPVKPYQCANCFKTFPTIRGVTHHNAQLHKDDLPPRIRRGKNTLYPCPICGKKLYSYGSRLTHIASEHAGEMDIFYKCKFPNCHLEFQTEEYRDQHIKTSHNVDASDAWSSVHSVGVGVGVGNESSLQYWTEQPESQNPSEFLNEQEIHDVLANVESVEVGGMMMKTEVEVSDVLNPEEMADFQFQAVEGIEDEADFTFSIINHAPITMEENFDL